MTTLPSIRRAAPVLRVALATSIAMASLLGTAPAATAAGTALLVDSFAATPEVAVAGESFELTVVLRNHTTRRADDVQVTVGASAAPSTEGAPATGATTDLAVVGTGNTQRIGRIAAESTATVTFTLASDPAARAGVHSVPVTVSYDTGGRPEQLTQSLGVLVTQLARLELTVFEFPDEVVAGESFDVLAEVMNTGEVRAGGVVLSLAATGPGAVGIDAGRQTVGSLDAGDIDVVEAVVTPPGAGKVEIALTIAYSDALGTVHETEHTRTVTVTASDTTGDPDAGDEAEDRGFFGSIAAFFRALFGLGE